VQEVTKKGKQGGSKGKKGGKGKGGGSSSGAEEPAVKAKFKPCASFFQFFLPDVSGGGKAALHPAMLPFNTPEDDDESEVSSSSSSSSSGNSNSNNSCSNSSGSSSGTGRWPRRFTD
jgi:hypothetical protein